MEDCLGRDGERRSTRLRLTNHLPTSSQHEKNDLCAGANTSAFSRRWLCPTLRISPVMWTHMSLEGIYPISNSCYAFTKSFQCHTDQDNHRRMKCIHPCVRVTCPRAHPCPLLCSDECGDCKFPIYDVKLPCGHIAKSVYWRVPSEFVL